MPACDVPLIPSHGSFYHCFNRLFVFILAYKKQRATYMKGGDFLKRNFYGENKPAKEISEPFPFPANETTAAQTQTKQTQNPHFFPNPYQNH